MILNKKNIKYHAVIWLFPLIGYQFYEYNYLNRNFVLILNVLLIAFVLAYCYKEIFVTSYKLSTIKTYRLLFHWILISCLFCPFAFWEQNISLSFRMSIEIFRYVFLFLLIKEKPSYKEITKFIDVYFLIHFGVRIIGLMLAPKLTFGFNDETEMNEARGFFRILLHGTEFVVLSFFMHLNSFFQNRKSKDLIFILLASICLFTSLVRQIIVFSMLVGLIYIVSRIRFKVLSIVFFIVVYYFASDFILNTKLPVIKDLVEISKNQVEDNKGGDTDIRLLEADYYSFKFNTNVGQIIFGNGNPHAYSEYGKKVIKLSTDKSYYANDLGYVLIYITNGLIGLFLFLLMFYKSLKLPANDNFIWCKLFLGYLLLANIASDAISSSGITVSIVIYLLIQNSHKPFIFRYEKAYLR